MPYYGNKESKLNLFTFLSIEIDDFVPSETKIHLAIWNGIEDPLDVFLAGNFKEWQEGQNKRNFERKNILAFIQLPVSDTWLFAGGYLSHGCSFSNERNHFVYQTDEIPELRKYSGRIIVNFKRPGRQSYLNADRWANEISIDSIRSKRLIIQEFSGYNKTLISKSKLDIIIDENNSSWKAALSNVLGIYIITDTITGKQYVGSATGEGGIWQRWCDYSRTGHGGNKELKQILTSEGREYAQNFQYAVLEIADTHVSNEEILERESYWKKVLCTIDFGYNRN